MVVKTVLVSDSDIYKTSNQLNIYTGDPDYDSFTVYLGGENTAVPDGTTVNFKTNLGRITDANGQNFFVQG